MVRVSTKVQAKRKGVSPWLRVGIHVAHWETGTGEEVFSWGAFVDNDGDDDEGTA